MPAATVHAISGQEWAAYVSAAASVGQAITAGLAIWYSGKLARDSAKRERLADENAARRIEEAKVAAEEQRRLDRHEKELAEIERWNRPIDLAISLAESAYDELREARDRYAEYARVNPGKDYMPPRGLNQAVAAERIPHLESQIDQAELVVALRHLAENVAPFISVSIRASSWIAPLDDKIQGIREAIDQIFVWRKVPDAAANTDQAEILSAR